MTDSGPRAELESLVAPTLAAVEAGPAVARELRGGPHGRLEIAGRVLPEAAGLVVLAVGKAALPMCRAVEDWAGGRIRDGLVVTKRAPSAAEGATRLSLLPIRETAHPVPDERSAAAGRELLGIAARARPEDLLLVLLSGGASALAACPADGIAPGELAATTRLLLTCGADIEEMNAVRKHLSALAGGQLAAAAACRRIEVLALSDVPGDRPDVIASGPCTPDPSTYAEALEVLARHALCEQVPAAVRRHLERGACGERPETPKPGDPRLERVSLRIVARNADALAAAATAARRIGLRPLVLGPVLRGEARRAGARLARLALALSAQEPLLLIAGGETTVRVRGSGRGGRNQELALAAALEWHEQRASIPSGMQLALLALASDGEDGPTPAAGACVDAATVARASTLGVEAGASLQANDSHGFFLRAGGSLHTGPSGTNVMDVALLRVAAPRQTRGVSARSK